MTEKVNKNADIKSKDIDLIEPKRENSIDIQNIKDVNTMNERLEKVLIHLEKANFEEYVEIIKSPKRIIFRNFIAGLSRGLGMAIGFTLLGALAIIVLQEIVRLNLPLIGKYIAEIVNIVEKSRLK